MFLDDRVAPPVQCFRNFLAAVGVVHAFPIGAEFEAVIDALDTVAALQGAHRQRHMAVGAAVGNRRHAAVFLAIEDDRVVHDGAMNELAFAKLGRRHRDIPGIAQKPRIGLRRLAHAGLREQRRVNSLQDGSGIRIWAHVNSSLFRRSDFMIMSNCIFLPKICHSNSVVTTRGIGSDRIQLSVSPPLPSTVLGNCESDGGRIECVKCQGPERCNIINL